MSACLKNTQGKPRTATIKKIKIEKLKEKLRDKNLSISETFAACGVDYNGAFAKIFKEVVWMSPSEYRESIMK
ncbi:MAG: AraC family transcriptional regulator [Gracilibacteraceae bacterium]|nr:AraC family transcriptional regulator [Gracilibacteraceae bacterium]